MRWCPLIFLGIFQPLVCFSAVRKSWCIVKGHQGIQGFKNRQLQWQLCLKQLPLKSNLWCNPIESCSSGAASPGFVQAGGLIGESPYSVGLLGSVPAKLLVLNQVVPCRTFRPQTGVRIWQRPDLGPESPSPCLWNILLLPLCHPAQHSCAPVAVGQDVGHCRSSCQYSKDVEKHFTELLL